MLCDSNSNKFNYTYLLETEGRVDFSCNVNFYRWVLSNSPYKVSHYFNVLEMKKKEITRNQKRFTSIEENTTKTKLSNFHEIEH